MLENLIRSCRLIAREPSADLSELKQSVRGPSVTRFPDLTYREGPEPVVSILALLIDKLVALR